MLVYILIMLCISFFFYREGNRAKNSRSTLLKDFCKKEDNALYCSKQLHLVAGGALVSAALMAYAFVYSQILHAPVPRLPIALSFFVYTLCFCWALWRFYQGYLR